MNQKTSILIAVLVVTVVGICNAASGDLADENAELKQRVQQLDQELEEVKSALYSDEELDELPKPILSNLDVDFYGYLKLDMAYDTSRIENGNYAQWAEQEHDNDDDNQFNMTAKESRFGLNINGPDNGSMQTSGRVEVDFYGAGGAENKAELMMRHAYIKLDWPESKFDIIAGQTSDVISPLYPSTINYSVGWWVGNIGYRRPQIRITKELDFVSGGSLKLEGALARTIGRQDMTTDPTDSGEDAGFPTLQGRVSTTVPLFFSRTATLGLSAHVGEEEYDITDTGSNTDFDTWSVNFDITQPVFDMVTIQAELFTGENLDAYFGGIGQGVTTSGTNIYEEIGSKGGWIAASIGPWKNKKFNVGIAVDDVDRDDVNDGDRILNRCLFANVVCPINAQTDFGFELSHWRTEYHGSGDAESLRAQMALKYKF
ncbi:DcaP family trimeric outer membrane transporter [Planctomycetota bacterium]